MKGILINEFSKEMMLGKATFFIGSGISRQSGYASWKDILREVATEIDLDVEQEKDLITLAHYYVLEKQRTKITEAIKTYFSDRNGSPTEVHEILASFPINEIWTTNYDSLLERSFKIKKTSTTIITDDESYKDVDPEAKVKAYKIHGDVARSSECVITRSDYEGFGEKHDIILAELKAAMCAKSFLFLGYSFSDTDIQHILSKIRLTYKNANPKRHYCVVKNIEETEFETKEKFEYAKKKQKHYIKDMQSYGINVVLVDSYDEIKEILNEIRDKIYAKNVLISGSYESEDAIAENRISPIAQKLSSKLIQCGYKIFSGYGKNLGVDVVSGAYDGCTKRGKDIDEFGDNVFIYPFPYRQRITGAVKTQYTQIRENMIERTKICVIIAGKKASGKNIINSSGVYEEYQIAKRHGNLIIPVSTTGGVALQVWNELNLIEEYATNERFLQLKTEVNSDKIVEIIMELIKEKQEGEK